MSHTITTSSISNVQWGDLSQDGYYCSLSFDWDLDVDENPVSLFINLVDGEGNSIAGDLYTPEEVEFTGEDTYQISLDTISVNKNYSGVVHLSVIDGDDDPVAFDAGTSDELGTLPTSQTFNVVVTARDIEFSNYNSTTGKWGNAVMTMMIEDVDTPDNINLEVYDERLYAVFKNHDDTTDLIETSAEVDGMEFRVTISDPMTPSAKYELYKVYGETSGNEYATTSQFYIQVPGKVWDFVNDTVGTEDITLVSDWFNYGHVVTSDHVVHGAPTRQDIMEAGKGNAGTTVTVNGETINTDDIIGYKMTSLFTGENTAERMLSGYNSLQDVDIVSSGLTRVAKINSGGSTSVSEYGLWSTSFNKKFGFPSTMTSIAGWFRSLNNIYDKPIYMPDSVTQFGSFLYNDASNFTSKIRFSPNVSNIRQYNLLQIRNASTLPEDIKGLSTNVQLGDGAHPFWFMFGSKWPTTYNVPSRWTFIPSYFLYYYGGNLNGPETVVLPEGLASIHTNALVGYSYKKVHFPSTLRSVSNGTCYSWGDPSNGQGTIVENLENTSLTSVPPGFLGGCSLYLPNGVPLPNAVTVYPNDFMSANYGWVNAAKVYGVPLDADNNATLTIPNHITTIGNNVFRERLSSGNDGSIVTGYFNKVIVPASVTSIGTGFCSTRDDQRNVTIIADLTQTSPDVFQDGDTSSFARTAGYWGHTYVTAYVAPGTSEAWSDKLPDIELNPGPSFGKHWGRKVTWVEPTPQYGYVFYKENWSDTEEKYVELQSVAEFESLAGTAYNRTMTVGADQITLTTGASNTSTDETINTSQHNIITGVRIGTDITSIPSNFLKFCKGIGNKDVIIPDNVTNLGTGFMHYCTGFSGKVRFPSNITSIPNQTLTQVNNFNHPIVIPEGVTSIGNSFLANAYIFDSSITLPSTLTSIGSDFLYDGSPDVRHPFNQPISVPNSVTNIGGNFLYGRVNFNQQITLPPGLTTLGGSFMSGCKSFNQPITVPAGVTQLYGFLNWCSSFNSEITILGTLTQIGGYFMRGMTSFDRDLNLPCGTNCRFSSDIAFAEMKSMTHTINFNDLQASRIYSPSQRPAFATQDGTAACYTTGIKISGIDSAAIVAMFPDLDGTGTGIDSGYYRHLIRTGTSQPTNPGGK